MTLRTSSRKMNPFWNMIGFTIRKNLGIIIVLCIAALLYYPGSFIVNYEDLLYRVDNDYNIYLLENFGNAITVLSAVVAIFFNMINFGFLYKKNSSDVFHSFPLTRNELLLSRFIASFVSAFIPVILCYISFGALMAFNSWMGSFAVLLYYLLHTVLITLVCSSFSMIFVVSAGSSFDLGVSLVGGNLALIAVGAIFESILDETLYGYNGYSTSTILYNISPPYFCADGLSSVDRFVELGFVKGANIEFLVRSVIYIILFTVISLLLYNRRKAEKGGTAYAYKFMYLGCSLLAGICGGYALGMMFIGDINSIGFWLFAIIGSLLTTVIYGTITNRGFKGVGRSLLMGALSAVVMLAVAVGGIIGGFGYSTRIPKTSRIESVSIEIFGENITFEDPQKVTALHKAILDRDATDLDHNSQDDGGFFITTYSPDCRHRAENIKIYYELKNGQTVSRDYYVCAYTVADKLLDIYKSDERLDMINEQTNFADAQDITMYFYYLGQNWDVSITPSEAKEFLDAYWQDVMESDESIFNESDYDYLELSGYKMVDRYRENYFYFVFEDHTSFNNTTHFIQNNDLVKRAQEQQVETNEKY